MRQTQTTEADCAHLNVPQAEHPAERQEGFLRRLYSQLVLRLLPILRGLLYGGGGCAIKLAEMLLTR